MRVARCGARRRSAEWFRGRTRLIARISVWRGWPAAMVVAGTSALIDGSGFEIVAVTAASARRMAQACRRWGGVRIRLHSISEIVSPTSRRARRCSLPYTGEDFRKTDVRAAPRSLSDRRDARDTYASLFPEACGGRPISIYATITHAGLLDRSRRGSPWRVCGLCGSCGGALTHCGERVCRRPGRAR